MNKRGRPLAFLKALETGIEPPDWDEGNCRLLGLGTEFFYPEDHHAPRTRSYERARDAAKGVCADCPIRVECAEWAIATRQEGGIWGGLTNDDRKNVRSIRYNQALEERRDRMKAVVG